MDIYYGDKKKKVKASTILGVISKIRQLYINRRTTGGRESNLELILNITNGDPMLYKRENEIIDCLDNKKTISPVTLDITEWVKY